MKIKAAVLWEAGVPAPYGKNCPLSIEEIELDPPKEGEVLIRVKAVGLCHSDLVAINGERPKPTPIVIGHEAAGIIEEVGPGVSGFKVGEHVVPTYVASCGTCDMCEVGRPALCEPATVANAAGTLRDGTTRLHKDGVRINHHSGIAGFAEYAVIPKEALVKIDKSIPFEHAALFGCGVITGAGAVINTAGIKAGEKVAVVGLGGVGLSSILAAVAAGAGQVVAIDLNDEKLALAKELGAHETVNASQPDCIEQVRELTSGGVHSAIETAGSPRALVTAYAVTRRGGTTVTAGMPGPEANVTLSHLSIAAEERTIKGSYMGSCVPGRDIPRYMSMFKDGKMPVDKLLSRTIGFEELNAALDRLDNAVTVREVLIP